MYTCGNPMIWPPQHVPLPSAGQGRIIFQHDWAIKALAPCPEIGESGASKKEPDAIWHRVRLFLF